MINKYNTVSAVEVVPQNFQGEDYDSKIKIVGSLVDIVFFEFPRRISNDHSSLHEYVCQPLIQGVAIHDKILCAFWKGQDLFGSQHNACFDV